MTTTQQILGSHEVSLASMITGMLLERDHQDVINMTFNDEEMLKQSVEKAAKTLKEHHKDSDRF